MAPESSIPTQLASELEGRYRVQRELGAGGMATVYLAHDVRHDRLVALKVLRQDVAQSLGSERFLREIHLAAKLSHPHILPLFDSGDARGFLYFVMPNVEGFSLRDRLNKEPKLPLDEALRVVREVADALDYAHRHGVVHRDIKPENIMLHDGHAMVADFGIGKALSSVEGEVFTQSGITIGTPAYMSPEQAAGDAVDGRTDIYSLGCVLYEMLTGEQPFTGPTAQAVIAKRFVQTPADVSALREGVSRGVASAVARALARAPIDRFDTGASLIAALSQSAAPRTEAPEKSIAVLPFANMSADPENEFFADGITEEILNALAQIPELRVAGRTSAFSYKGKNVDLRSIGDQLGVRNVLEGSVRKAGKRVRITAQLIDVNDGYHLWSERYDREIEDVFAVQDEIAAAIADRMKATFNRAGGAAARDQRATESIEAYEAYLKGRALMYRRGAALKQGIVLMEKALALDPRYGLAWSGIADAHSVLGYYAQLSPEEAGSKARHASLKALELSPDLSEAHSSRAMVSLLYDWDFAAAEREFKRALELNPGQVQGAVWYSLFYTGFIAAQWDKAFAGLLELQNRDPNSAYVASCLSIGHSAGGDPAESLKWAERAMELEPAAFLSMWSRQMAYGKLGDWDNAIEAADAVLAMSGRHPFSLTTLAWSYIEGGQVEDGRAVFHEMQARARREPVSPAALSSIAAALEDSEAAMDYATEALRRHDPQLALFSQSWPLSRHLRALPGFKPILAAMGLPLTRPA
jgi:serine/threonine protein kinase/tetratricopeptide (TPR) repeat protein